MTKRQVQHVVDNYRTYSGVLAVLGTAGSSARAALWPETGEAAQQDSSDKQQYLDDIKRLEDRINLREAATQQCWKCEFREREKQQEQLERLLEEMAVKSTPTPFSIFENASTEFTNKVTSMTEEKVFSADVVSR